MKYNIIIPNNKMKKYHIAAIKEFEKRLSRYCKTKLISIKKENDLEQLCKENSYKIQIETVVSRASSSQIARKLGELFVGGISTISIFINIQVDEPDWVLPISPMDMDTGLSVAIVYEQLYRSYRILNNQPYHK